MIDIYALPWVKFIASGRLLYSTGSSSWYSGRVGGGEGWEGGHKGGDMCIPMADSHCCMAETTTTL